MAQNRHPRQSAILTRPRRIRRSRGTATVEAALLLPFLVFIFFGTVEICNQIYFAQSVSIAAYEGARVALIPEATLADVKQQVEEVAAARQLPTPCVTVSPSNFDSQPAGTFITITIDCPAKSALGVNLFGDSLGKSSVTVMKEF